MALGLGLNGPRITSPRSEGVPFAVDGSEFLTYVNPMTGVTEPVTFTQLNTGAPERITVRKL